MQPFGKIIEVPTFKSDQLCEIFFLKQEFKKVLYIYVTIIIYTGYIHLHTKYIQINYSKYFNGIQGSYLFRLIELLNEEIYLERIKKYKILVQNIDEKFLSRDWGSFYSY